MSEAGGTRMSAGAAVSAAGRGGGGGGGGGGGAGRILFLSPTFLAYRLHKLVRGVELADLLLIRSLVRLGYDVTVPAERTWRKRFEEAWAGDGGARGGGGVAMPRVVYTPSLRKPAWNGLWAAWALGRSRYDVCVLGNTAVGLIPGAWAMRRRGLFDRAVVIAHRTPKRSMVRFAAGMKARVVAVSETVARAFPSDYPAPVVVSYGLGNAEEYVPREGPRGAEDGREKVRFFMLGKLDTPLKNAAMVVRAFAAMPAAVRERSELHLASYPDPAKAGELPRGVVAHPWMGMDAVPGFVRRMDVLVVASDSETFSQAAVQAMLTGLPVITRPLPAVVEKVQSGAGVVINTEADLTAAMARLATDADLRARMGAEGRRVALEKYVWDAGRLAREHFFPPA